MEERIKWTTETDNYKAGDEDVPISMESKSLELCACLLG